MQRIAFVFIGLVTVLLVACTVAADATDNARLSVVNDDSLVGRSRRLQTPSWQHAIPHRSLLFGSIWDFIMDVLEWFLNLFGLGGDNDDDDDGNTGLAHPDDQFTPNVADWSTFYDKPAAANSVVDHSPDGVTWLNIDQWPEWDGNVIDPASMTEQEFHRKICPSADTILGLRELYYNGRENGEPFFKDSLQPTKAEVDHWHAASLTHLRRLVGIDHPAQPDHCLFARALWGQELKRTDKWDDEYPDQICGPGSSSHCGATFMLDAEDQIDYLPDSGIIGTCPRLAGSEGISSAAKSNIPWSVKWVRVFCSFLGNEGYNGGHVGPFFRREKFGWSFMDMDPSNNNNNAIFRGKWAGTLVDTPWVVPKSYVEIFLTD